MKRFSCIGLFLILFSLNAVAQKPRPRPRATPKPSPSAAAATGTVKGKTYTNTTFRFEVTFPDTWLIPGDDFEAAMKKQGFDLSLTAPDSLSPLSRSKLDRALERVAVLLTAYRSMPGSSDNAIARISTEDLSLNPQIRDAVDYFDAMRATFASMKLPSDFVYSETQAEKLGDQQFGFIDTRSNDGKKRMYATVRGGHALLFTLSYTNESDLVTFRDILAKGDFSLR